MTRRRIFYSVVAVIIGLLFAVGYLFYFKKPTPQIRAEIFQGVFLTVEDAFYVEEASGKTMILEVHWDAPGLRLANRPFDYDVNPEDTSGPHYELKYADVALRQADAAILVNTSLYTPADLLNSLPTRPVRSIDTLVVDGQISHIHAHSYLLYWDDAMNAELLLEKPPAQDKLEKAVLGIGMQGVQVMDGRPNYNALGDQDIQQARTFIGIDPDGRRLYLMAFENATGRHMINRAIQAGVIYGGQLDSGDATNLIIGADAQGVAPYTGLRNLRPLGPYLTIYAEPIMP